MSGETMSEEELLTLFEAARWAPSSYNNQPWRFIYAQRDTEYWQTFFGLLGEFNQSWCKNAAALVVVAARKTFEYNKKPSVTHAFDTGSAWENLAIQASATGYVAHGMEGFDYKAAALVLRIPDDYAVLAMIAIGKPGKKEDLPEDLKQQEQPNDRRLLEEIVMEGLFRE